MADSTPELRAPHDSRQFDRAWLIGQIETSRSVLRQHIEQRLPTDPRSAGWVDAEGFLQVALLELAVDVPSVVNQQGVPLYSYLRNHLVRKIALLESRCFPRSAPSPHVEVQDWSAATTTEALAWLYGERLERLAQLVDRSTPELLEGLEALAPAERDPLLLIHCEELSPEQVGRVTGLTPLGLERRLQSALDRLRDH